MSNMVEFAKALAAEAEKRGLRIVIEPINTTSEATVASTGQPAETHEAKPVSKPTEAVSVPKIVSPAQKEKVRRDNSWIRVANAARMLRCSTSVIYRRARFGMIPSRIAKDGVLEVSTEILNGIPAIRSHSRKGIPVECIETGERFPSMTQAAVCFRGKSASPAGISDSIRNGWSYHGFHFRAIESQKS